MGKKILTVDDASTIRKMVSYTLKEKGHEVLEAADGSQALDVLQSNNIDLILSDINMPVMDGLEMTRQIRSQPSRQSLPIILLTTESEPQKKAEGRAAGATGWIVKPFNPTQLLAIVDKVLS